MTDPQDIPQPPPYDGPDWDDGDEVPTATCPARTPSVQFSMALHDSDHRIQEGPTDAGH